MQAKSELHCSQFASTAILSSNKTASGSYILVNIIVTLFTWVLKKSSNKTILPKKHKKKLILKSNYFEIKLHKGKLIIWTS